ncbi:MAG: phosphotransferase family protein [Acidimicrobiaceae bacterium]|nr:phosphotransferase family protein [Acidimicrobiaceae bacterium]|tara:strand:- start:23 stop:1057 length:1035 start_codon:yes stop_codon:yes gene_type:complete
MTSGSPAGIHIDNVKGWLKDRTLVEGELEFDLVTHGRSNLTYVVTDQNQNKWVLRRPPTGHVLASAHDMGREHRIISALQGSKVPVPSIIGMCDDSSVTGAPFFVMSFVQGHIIKDLEDSKAFSQHERRKQSESLVDVLVDLHAVDPDSIGLGDLGKKEDYVGRQLRRWKRQVDEGSDREIPLFNDLHSKLEKGKPKQIGSGITHGDYRLDNCMIGHDNKIAAVLDWELCTLGDVLADLGGMLMWWGKSGNDNSVMNEPPTLADGYLTIDEVVDRYAELSGRDLSNLPYYIAFQFWRLAAIIEGVRVRFTAGAMGNKDIGDELRGFKLRIDGLLQASVSTLERI